MAKDNKKPLIMEIAAFIVALFSFIFAVKKYFSKKEPVRSGKKRKTTKRKK
jgi:hypothetical protein